MHPRVRAQYKQLVILAQQHPTKSLSELRPEIKKYYFKNKDLIPESEEWKRALAKGRYWGIKQLETIIHVHKFRAMKKRYDFEPPNLPE